MTQEKPRRDPESVADVLLGGVWAGLGCVVVGAVLVGSLYLFEPSARSFVETHAAYFMVGALVLFLVGWGMSVQSVLEIQFWRGKWK
ncbi:MAG: hypothetical protein WBQ08_08720 [Candidatus Sulfotelmatobacter sp.]